MNKRIFTASLLLAACAAISLHAAETKTDWCTLVVPDKAEMDKPFDVAVTLNAGIPKTLLAVDLHWMKKDGSFGGMLSWVPRREVEGGQSTTISHQPALKEEMASVSVLAYLSPDGDYAKRTQEARAALVPVVIDAAVVAAKAAEAARIACPPHVTFKKSMIRVIPPTEPIEVNRPFTVKVDYVLDPSENWADGTKLILMPLGPWIDNPDGVYTTGRFHVGIPGLDTQVVDLKPGKGTLDFTFTAQRLHRYNDVQWMANFIGGDGKGWPWQVRAPGPAFIRTSSGFDVVVKPAGGLFTYDEPVSIDLTWREGSKAGETKTVQIAVTDSEGRNVGQFTQTVTVGNPGDAIAVPLKLTARGTLLVEATIDGLGTREHFIARIPDVPKILGGRPTPFGAHLITTREMGSVARKLGLTYVRHFVAWSDLEPLPNQWHFEKLDATLAANRQEGLVPWICLVSPPSWVTPVGVHSAGFEPFPFDAKAWENSIRTIAARYANSGIWGFEWLNEIVPGDKSQNPAADYLAFCRIGTKVVRSVNPKLGIQMAGGLWPRNFRTDLLGAGLTAEVDVLPIHYNNYTGVREAIRDTATFNAKHLEVWDNETAAGLSVWDMPPIEALKRSRMQSQWVMRNGSEELVAGAKKIIYFGGVPLAAGNWNYLLDERSPRPVAATLAVFSAKLGLAKPVGRAYVGVNGAVNLFERDRESVLVAYAEGVAEKRVTIPVGAASVVVTDCQGNETSMQTQNGQLSITLGEMPVFIEGADLDSVKTLVGLEIGGGDLPQGQPQVLLLEGDKLKVPMTLRNPLDKPLNGTVTFRLDGGWAMIAPVQIDLKPGETRKLDAELVVDANAKIPEISGGTATLSWTAPVRVSLDRPFGTTLLRRTALGNLLKNGGMEEADAQGRIALWNTSVKPTPSHGGLGLGESIMRFSDDPGWPNGYQRVELPVAGQTYLYTLWLWNHDMRAGSNMNLHKRDGSTEVLFIPQVFSSDQSTPSWRLMRLKYAAAPDVAAISFQPVCNGNGWAQFDNVRVTLYDGSDDASEASRTRGKPVKVDGDLADWDNSNPIPLLCDNQLSLVKPGYAWTPDNLSGVAYLRWDDEALYLAAQVKDNRHVARTGEETGNGDSLMIAFNPAPKDETAGTRAFKWNVSSASPGGGSGKHTLYRPAAFSAGRPSGQLAKDSSLYDLAVIQKDDTTVYELRLPWSETGVAKPAVGAKLGLSLQLNDSDGDAREAAMIWGGGLQPVWNPASFGIITLID